MTVPRRSQVSGQTLPLFAIMVPGLLALMALGLDGAQIFLERRDAQSAADLAALSGVRSLPDDATTAKSDATAVAVAHGYAQAQVVPVSPYDSNSSKIEVTINSSVTTFLMPILNFFGPGDNSGIDVAARAVAQMNVGASGGGDYALFTLEPCGDKEDFTALNWSGNVNPIIGSVHTSSGATISGNGQSVSGQFTVTCDAGNITDKFPYNETGDNQPELADGGGPGGFAPADCTGSEPPGWVCRADIPPPPIPDFATLQLECDYTRNGDVDFATESGPWRAPDGDLYAGVYCTDRKLSLSLANINVVPTQGREGITLLANEIVISGNDNNLLPPHLDGILMYANTTEEGKGIDYAANGGTFEGILYSPNAKSKIKWAGNSNTLTGGLVGYRVEYSGESNTLIGTYGESAGGDPTIAIVE